MNDLLEQSQDTPRSKKRNSTVFWQIAEDIPRALSWQLMTISVVVPFCFWWTISNAIAANGKISFFLPTPSSVWLAAIDLWQQGFLLQDIIASCSRVGIGFLMAAVLSVPIGIAMGTFASIRALFEPIIGIVRYMPVPALTPLLIIYFGVDEASKIALIFIGTFFFNVLMIMDAVKFVPKELIETTYTLGGSRLQVLLQVIVPYTVPKIIDAFRINIAASWQLVSVAELIAASEGLGKRIALARKFNGTDQIFVCLIILGLIGFALDLSFRWLQRTSCKWAFD